MPVIIPVIMLAATAASMAMQASAMAKGNAAAKASAQLAKDTAGYNQRVDEAGATQTELDSDANIAANRKDASIYLSRQKTAFAANGVLSTGSALAVEATTAGQLEQRVLQDRTNALRQAEQQRAAGRMGVLYGDAQASGIMAQNSVDMMRGGAGILSTAASAAGSFSMGGAKAGVGGGSDYVPGDRAGFGPH